LFIKLYEIVSKHPVFERTGIMATETSIHSELLNLFGPLDAHRALEIMELHPSLADLEVASAYFSGMSDVMGEERLPLAGIAARIYEIVSRDEALLEEEGRQG
jgi:hypothetical protein